MLQGGKLNTTTMFLDDLLLEAEIVVTLPWDYFANVKAHDALLLFKLLCSS
jgi:hypothetical protein